MDIETLKIKLEESEKTRLELQSRVDELTDFVENASIPLHWVNGSGIIVWANKAELESLGYSKEEYIGKHISNFHADKNVIEDILSRLIRKETLKNYPAQLLCKNGQIKPVLINSNVLWKDDKFVHTRCFTRDITDLKTLEAKKTDLINELSETNRELRTEIEQLKKKLSENLNNFKQSAAGTSF
ncbi:MAG: putative Histidine kinase [Bacteroidetes bacterium]|jgi:PAS domain S-box-containing protein|nr:putative Histidine kinase [Bacteroidota bacterium]